MYNYHGKKFNEGSSQNNFHILCPESAHLHFFLTREVLDAVLLRLRVRSIEKSTSETFSEHLLRKLF